MNWSDRGLVLGARAHGESAVVLELMTREHGRHLGLVHGGRSRRLRPVLQPGNAVAATWRARLDEQLGTFTVEPETSRTARLIATPLGLHGVAALAAHLGLLPERDPHPHLFDAAGDLLDRLGEGAEALASFVRFEVALLAELGFGLDLASCAVTGRADDLRFVSPRTGRAVGGAAGEPWRDRLLSLPRFLADEESIDPPAPGEVAISFRLTGHFLARFVYEPRGLAEPDARTRLVALADPAAASGIREAGGPADSAPDGNS